LDTAASAAAQKEEMHRETTSEQSEQGEKDFEDGGATE
jgi:hypothetical protein